MARFSDVTITEPDSILGPQETLEALVDSYRGEKMSPQTLARLRYEVGRFGEKHVFMSTRLRKLHVGAMDEAAFTEFVGRPPEQDDLERVNCPDVGHGAHLMCGWCDEHEVPRFECACLATRRS